MIVILKIILSFLAVALFAIIRNVIKDFFSVKKTDGYDMLSLWKRLKFNAQFYFILVSLISLVVFFIYFIITPLSFNNNV
jgi:hypothetical protein